MTPMQPGAAPPQAVGQPQQPDQTGAMGMMQLDQVIQSNPQMVQQVMQVLRQAMQANGGQLPFDQEDIRIGLQIAQQITQNPATWPQARQHLLQVGFPQNLLPPVNATPEQLQRLAATIYLLVRMVGQMGGPQGAGMQGGAPVAAPTGAQGFAYGGAVQPLLYMPGFAAGGAVDSVPAMMSPGEYVLNPQAAQMMGQDNLDAINFAASGVPPGPRMVGMQGPDDYLPQIGNFDGTSG